jgi:HSP20 family protein
MTLVKFNSDNNKNNHKALMPTFGNVFDSVFTDSFFTGRDMAMVPAVNICDNQDQFEIQLAAPGLLKEDFKIALERKMLTVSVQKEQSNAAEENNFTRKEFSYTAFTRSFTLPESADENGIQAKYENGILFVTISKREEARNAVRQIQVS